MPSAGARDCGALSSSDARRRGVGLLPRTRSLWMVAAAEGTSNWAAAPAVDAGKIYGEGESAVRALDGVTVEFERGRFAEQPLPAGGLPAVISQRKAEFETVREGKVLIG